MPFSLSSISLCTHNGTMPSLLFGRENDYFEMPSFVGWDVYVENSNVENPNCPLMLTVLMSTILM